VERYNGTSWDIVTGSVCVLNNTSTAVQVGTPSSGSITWNTLLPHPFTVGQQISVSAGLDGPAATTSTPASSIYGKIFTIGSVTSNSFVTSNVGTDATGSNAITLSVTSAAGIGNSVYLSAANLTALQAAYPAASYARRWAAVTDVTLDSFARLFYSDGVTWRGPMRSKRGPQQYLGSDYGVYFNNVNGSIAIGNLHLRQVGQFTASSVGTIRMENTNNSVGTVLIANLQLEQSYGTDLNVVTSGRSNLIISNAVKDFTMAPNLTTTGSGNTILLYNFAANSASLGGIAASQYARLASANFIAASVGGAAVATQPYVNSLGFLTSSGPISTAFNSASLGGIPAQQYVSSSTVASIGTVPTWTGTGWAPAARNRFRAGTWTYHDGTSTTTTPFTVNQLNIAPVVTGGNGIQALTLHENTVGVPSASIRVLVYSDGPDGWPTDLVGSALFNAASSGQYTASGLTIPGSPTGRHWIGTVGNTSTASARVWVNRIPGAALATITTASGTPITTGLRFQLPGPTPPTSLSASPATNATYVGVVAVQLS
jgi:hypothetical protein